MGYKVGQKVLVRKDLYYEGDYYMEGGVHRNGVVSSMINLKGQVATILTVFSDGSGYTLKEDKGCWTWTDEMLELSNEITIKQLSEKNMKEEEGNSVIFSDGTPLIFHPSSQEVRGRGFSSYLPLPRLFSPSDTRTVSSHWRALERE